MIRVTRSGGDSFSVVLDDGGGRAGYVIIAAPETVERLAPGADPEALIEASFRFLLDREPKEAILARFNLAEISRYFPDYDTELPRYLSHLRR